MLSSIFKNELLKWDLELLVQDRKIKLLGYNCTAHPDINNLLTNIKLAVLPANTTSVLNL